MKHMDIAYAQLGVAETPGVDATPAILRYFERIGRPDVVSDEVAWCGGFVGYVCLEAGVDTSAIKPHEALLARSYLRIGVEIPLDAPRFGCLAVFRRDSAGPHAGHVGFVIGWTATHIMLLGGNQGNKVSAAPYPRADLLGLRWIGPQLTTSDLDKQGSRITQAAHDQQIDANKATAVQTGHVVPQPPKGVGQAADTIGEWVGLAGKGEAFLVFAWAKLPWIALGVTVYLAARMFWRGALIRGWRTEDANTGAHQGRVDDAAVEAA